MMQGLQNTSRIRKNQRKGHKTTQGLEESGNFALDYVANSSMSDNKNAKKTPNESIMMRPSVPISETELAE